MSLSLNWAKNNSHGAASYEWGPRNIIGILRVSNIFIEPFDVWYGALSRIITVSLLQFYLCLSSFFTKLVKKMSIIVVFEFVWVSDKKTSPVLSIATIIEILGDISVTATELVDPFTLHFRRLKSVIPNQVSSTLMKNLFDLFKPR